MQMKTAWEMNVVVRKGKKEAGMDLMADRRFIMAGWSLMKKWKTLLVMLMTPQVEKREIKREYRRRNSMRELGFVLVVICW